VSQEGARHGRALNELADTVLTGNLDLSVQSGMRVKTWRSLHQSNADTINFPPE
jgi:hypothetical protein